MRDGDTSEAYTYAHDFIERRVWADAELSSGYVVADGCWNQYNRNTELRVLVSRLGQHQRAVVRLNTGADSQGRIPSKFAQFAGLTSCCYVQ